MIDSPYYFYILRLIPDSLPQFYLLRDIESDKTLRFNFEVFGKSKHVLNRRNFRVKTQRHGFILVIPELHLMLTSWDTSNEKRSLKRPFVLSLHQDLNIRVDDLTDFEKFGAVPKFKINDRLEVSLDENEVLMTERRLGHLYLKVLSDSNDEFSGSFKSVLKLRDSEQRKKYAGLWEVPPLKIIRNSCLGQNKDKLSLVEMSAVMKHKIHINLKSQSISFGSFEYGTYFFIGNKIVFRLNFFTGKKDEPYYAVVSISDDERATLNKKKIIELLQDAHKVVRPLEVNYLTTTVPEDVVFETEETLVEEAKTALKDFSQMLRKKLMQVYFDEFQRNFFDKRTMNYISFLYRRMMKPAIIIGLVTRTNGKPFTNRIYNNRLLTGDVEHKRKEAYVALHKVFLKRNYK